ncbi:hypothetical protein [Corallococcus macrosporus]|uniref:HNH nuclease domain-containing protein n=1 Tax=Myxococcus fulvus (strain ATCC BAA-855 / HW-1) TaxID=483219 RepID=F8CC54_MYXFH|nr:hypothetical protein [Corallococcus macrosporus]AEI67211.1 hypothetical protein LILAB_26595 [Corallococcus macrosporus]
MIRIARGAAPIGLEKSAPRYQAAAAKVFNRHRGMSDALQEILSKGYNSRATKQALYLAQHEKCAWCERQMDFSSSPVEHYRPKDGAWRHLPGQKPRIDKGHYWWLAWSWSNLLFSCSRCNDRGHKANYFPLRRKTRKARAPKAPVSRSRPDSISDVSKERPLLLDPAGAEDPLDHIEWYPTNTSFNRRDWLWTPLGLTDEGRATIEILQLSELAGRAQGHVRSLLPIIEEVEQHLAAGRIPEAHKRWNQLIADSFTPEAQWSAFAWHALRHLVPPSYRAQHQLADPRRPGAP